MRDRTSGDHGMLVISHAVSDGVGPGSDFVIGPGFDLEIRPIGMGGWSASDLLAGFSLLANATEFSQVRAVSFSETVWYLENPQPGEFLDTLELLRARFDAVIDQVLAQNKILVCSAGNAASPIVDSQLGTNYYCVPAERGPSGARSASPAREKLVVVVGASCEPLTTNTYAGVPDPARSEDVFFFSNVGPQVSLVAPGYQVPAVTKKTGEVNLANGTSFSAPFVAAVITQLFTIDSQLQNDPVKAIEIVEATADPLAAVPGTDQGHGRVNVWKAFLTAANGHLGSQPTPANHFTSLQTMSHQADDWYGIEILTDTYGATAWLYDGTTYTALADSGAPALTDVVGSDTDPARCIPQISSLHQASPSHVTTYMAVREGGARIPYPEGSLRSRGLAIRYLASATVHTSQMQQGGTSLRLMVYPAGIDPLVPGSSPVIDAALNPVQMRLLGNSTDAGIRKHVRAFDDFVFTIQEAPKISFAAATSQGTESVGTADVVVVLDRASAATVSVDYAVTGGSASGGGVDYSLAAGTLTFAPGDASKGILISVVDDAVAEPGETIVIALSSPVNSELGSRATHTYTVLDNDP